MKEKLKLILISLLTAFLVVILSVSAQAEEVIAVIYTDEYLLNKQPVEVGISPDVAETNVGNMAVNEKLENANEYSEIAEKMTQEERELLDRVVAAESQTQSMTGRMAVVEVIFNRVLADDFPDTVKGVLSQKGQFAGYRYRNADWVVPELGADAVAEVVLLGRTVLPDTDYLFFSRGKGSHTQDNIRIEEHWFGRAR